MTVTRITCRTPHQGSHVKHGSGEGGQKPRGQKPAARKSSGQQPGQNSAGQTRSRPNGAAAPAAPPPPGQSPAARGSPPPVTAGLGGLGNQRLAGGMTMLIDQATQLRSLVQQGGKIATLG